MQVALRAADDLRREVSPDALHTIALIDLTTVDKPGIQLDRSIKYLRMATRISSDPVDALSDLAAAHLTRASLADNVLDVFDAIEYASAALRKDSTHKAARFNLSLALDAMALDSMAAASWSTYLALDSRSPWSKEATDRLHRLADHRGVATSALDLQRDRVNTWDVILPRWGQALLAGDIAAAHASLMFADSVSELVRKTNGDETLAEAVRNIRNTSDSARLSDLAKAHVTWGEAIAAYDVPDHKTARTKLESLLRTTDKNTLLYRWAEIFHAATLFFQGSRAAAIATLERTTADPDSLKFLALHARGRWMLGTTYLKTERISEALSWYRSAESLYTRLGEREHLGGMRELSAEATLGLGYDLAALDQLGGAIAGLSQFRRSVHLHNGLWFLAGTASASGWLNVAYYASQEGLLVTREAGRPIHIMESLLNSARMAALRGESALAAINVDDARGVLSHLSDANVRAYFTSDLRHSEAVVSHKLQSDSAMPRINEAVHFFERGGSQPRLAPALLTRADVFIEAGDAAGAATDLRRLAGILRSRATDPSGGRPNNASLDNAMKDCLDRLIMLRVNRKEQEQALVDMSAVTGLGTGLVSRDGRGDARAPLRIFQRFVGDTLLTWTLEKGDVSFKRAVVGRDSTLARVARLRANLELGSEEGVVRDDLAHLFDVLIRPVIATSTDETELLIAPDLSLMGIPYAALYDTASQSYLTEKRPVSLLVASSIGTVSALTSSSQVHNALLVADPAFGADDFPGLIRLQGASSEIATVAAMYGGSLVLDGSAATRTRVLTELKEASLSLFHFAGHAVFDERRPDRSHLVLARPTGSESHGLKSPLRAESQLTAADIAKLRLAPNTLVVLSACETGLAAETTGRGINGLAGAFVSAGAGNVIASLWPVGDDASRVQLAVFHSEYRKFSNAAQSLRASQLALLRSSDPRMRLPSAWAVFVHLRG